MNLPRLMELYVHRRLTLQYKSTLKLNYPYFRQLFTILIINNIKIHSIYLTRY